MEHERPSREMVSALVSHSEEGSLNQTEGWSPQLERSQYLDPPGADKEKTARPLACQHVKENIVINTIPHKCLHLRHSYMYHYKQTKKHTQNTGLYTLNQWFPNNKSQRTLCYFKIQAKDPPKKKFSYSYGGYVF